MSTNPSRLGKYELRKLLGRGSTGEVWKGFDLQARSDVAVKLLHPDLLQTDPNFMTTFMKEWQSISSLHHPNIVQVHEVNISRPSTSSGTILTSAHNLPPAEANPKREKVSGDSPDPGRGASPPAPPINEGEGYGDQDLWFDGCGLGGESEL